MPSPTNTVDRVVVINNAGRLSFVGLFRIAEIDKYIKLVPHSNLEADAVQTQASSSSGSSEPMTRDTSGAEEYRGGGSLCRRLTIPVVCPFR